MSMHRKNKCARVNSRKVAEAWFKHSVPRARMRRDMAAASRKRNRRK